MTCFYNIIYHIILHESIDDVEKLWQRTKKLPLLGELDSVLALSVGDRFSTERGADVANGGRKRNKVDLRSKDGEGA